MASATTAKVGCSPAGRGAAGPPRGRVLPCQPFSCRGPEVCPVDQVLRVAGPGDRQHVGQAQGHVPAAHDAAAARGRDRRSGNLLRPWTSPAGSWCSGWWPPSKVWLLSAMGMEPLERGRWLTGKEGCFAPARVSARE